jgi:hypothetical protein
MPIKRSVPGSIKNHHTTKKSQSNIGIQKFFGGAFMKMKLKGALISTALALGAAAVSPAFAAWEPTKPVEFIIPAGPGGGAGGVNLSGRFDNTSAEAVIGDSPLHGRIPGGGGAGSGCWTTCVCTAINSGRGAPGLVKISY